jgi:hypothetical protein
MAMTQFQAAATLGLSVDAFYSLTSNAGFASPVSDDGNGNIFWNDSDITGFVTTMAQAATNGWVWQDQDLPGCNWTYMAANPCGPYARTPFVGAGGSGGLFD